MTVPSRVDLARVSEQVGVAAVALTRWYTQQDSEVGNPLVAGNEAVAAIDSAVRSLWEARGRLTGDLRAEENARARRVDAMLAERRGERCLHAEDSRHRSVYGPPVPVRCGCSQTCCAMAELMAGDPNHGNSGPGGPLPPTRPDPPDGVLGYRSIT
jgi:hypothetical protein